MLSCQQQPMQDNFWTRLYLKKKGIEPIFVLAPMADVTDYVFRNLIAQKSEFGTENSYLDVLWTEFVSVNGLMNETGRKELIKDFRYDEKYERPIVAQIFGDKVLGFEEIGKLCKDLKFDGVDINMGCPDGNVNSQGSGAYMIKVPELAKEIFLATQRGAGGIPVSVKTRIGYNKIEWQEWLGEILKVKPVCITIHLRTKKEMSLVPAHWELSREIVDWIRENFGTVEKGGPIIILNGDVKDCLDGIEKWKVSGCDGIMIGRGVFGNPMCFNRNIKKEDLSIKEILLICVEHTKLFEKEIPFKSFAIMKKHFKAYVNGFPGAKELRLKMMEAKDAPEIEKVVKNWLFWHKIKSIFSW